jgi:hypothetical protein
MSFEVGQRVRLSTVVTNAAGTATDATMDIEVYREDGTPYVGVTPTHAGTPGNYFADVTLDAPGRLTWEWIASGAVVSRKTDQSYVRTGWAGIVSLRAAKNHLNKKLDDTTDDDEILDWIDALTIAIEKEAGPVVPRPYVETFDGGRRRLFLTYTPVASITEVREVWGDADVRILTPETSGGPFGDNDYYVDLDTGEIERRNGGYPQSFPFGMNNVRVSYRAGRVPIPANLRIATLELLAHHWRASQMSIGATRPRSDVPTDSTIMQYGMPNRVSTLIGFKRAPMLGG